MGFGEGGQAMATIDTAGNVGMRHLAQSLGFNREVDRDYPSVVIHALDL